MLRLELGMGNEEKGGLEAAFVRRGGCVYIYSYEQTENDENETMNK